MANWYIRDNASGSNNGTDWTNAWEDIDDIVWASVTRGDTIYVADGSYVGGTFNKAASGATYIYINKATTTAHGTETGWNSAYGDGTATFTSTFYVYTGYWEFSGVSRGADWKSGYGFKILLSNANAKAFRFDNGTYGNHVIVKYFEMEHRGVSQGTSDDFIYVIGDGVATNFTIQYCYMHDVSRVFFLTRQADNWTVEYCYFARNGDPVEHCELWSDDGSDNIIFRYNFCEDTSGTAIIMIGNSTANADAWEIYGNVIWHTPSFAFSISGFIRVLNDESQQNTATNWRVYNNTLVDLVGLWSGIRFGGGASSTGHIVYNNLWYSCCTAAHDNVNVNGNVMKYSWYYNTGENNDDAATKEAGADDIFVDYGNDDFRLANATDNGYDSLGSPYDVDLLGVTRGGDAVWDRGAYEYDEGGIIPGGLMIQALR